MLKTFSIRRRGAEGFTLIELLVVIAIIGVLASIVLASLNTARRKSRDARRITDIKQIQLALELFFDAQAVVHYPDATVTCDATNAYGLQVLAPTYIPQVSRDPNQTGADLCYRYATPTAAGNSTTYHLGAKLEDSSTASNPILANDRDCTSAAAGCGAAAYVSGFSGVPAAGVDPYYDVTP